MFKNINTLAVYVSDKEKAKKFYTDILGFEVSADLGPNLCFLKSGNGKINIYLEGGMKQTTNDNQTCRLSFFLQAEETANKTFESLKNAGVTLLQEQPEKVDDNIACFQFLDPDGNIIEVEGRIS
ncbi:MAG: VOC family protein [Candidatus Cloacimonetes bacterium]|nr:VOC family protein [Candidatus Cloacimonadota bacterium]